MTLHSRYIELDLLRTFAILLMVLYHIVFNLMFFEGLAIDANHGPWKLVGRTAAILFLLLVGISFVISWQKTSEKTSRFWDRYRKYVARGMGIVAWGLVISLVTAIWLPTEYIRFGILHLIGTATLLLPFFVRLREFNLLLGMYLITLGLFLREFRLATPWLMPLGIPYAGFRTLDYYPLLPWLGVILLGMSVGHFMYVRQKLPAQEASTVLKTLTWPGRHSLAIYLIHQPIILLVMYLF
jgi:uncharacterized membrane protein